MICIGVPIHSCAACLPHVMLAEVNDSKRIEDDMALLQPCKGRQPGTVQGIITGKSQEHHRKIIGKIRKKTNENIYIYIYIRRPLDRGATRLRTVALFLYPVSFASLYPASLYPCMPACL